MKVALALAMVLLVSAQKQVALVDDNSSETVTCSPGETVTLRIPSNVTTGYSWFLVPPTVSGTATLLNGNTGTYIPPNTNLVGAGGLQEFQLQCSDTAKTSDAYQFTLIKRRPWEDANIRTKTVTLLVE